MEGVPGDSLQDEGLDRGVALCIILGTIAYLLDDWLQSSNMFSLGSGTLAFIFGAIFSQGND